MSAVAIDTSFYIDMIQGDQAASRIIAQASRIVLSPIVVGELLCGMKGRANHAQLHQRLAEFSQSAGVEIAPLTGRTAQHYGQVCSWLRSQGTMIPTNDLWIAASALEHGVALATNDRHFRKIPTLMLI